MMKVSVVIATYRSGPDLDKAIESLDRQSMSPDDFEVLLIDDGSPDDTFDRLQTFTRTRVNVSAVQVAHSGWPSVPRNHGIEIAQGEYILFMDHDDVIGPDTLARSWELGQRNGADAVNIKETRTRLAGWGLPIFDRDWDDALGRVDHNPLGPMTPHKLYRRELLLRHGIRFPVGERAIWEDIFFNTDVLAAAKKISILSSVDGYHWRDTGVNSSLTFTDDPWEQWNALKAIFYHVRVRLGHRPWLADAVHANFLSSQIVPVLLAGESRFGGEWPAVRADIHRTVRETVSAGAIVRLDAHRRALLELSFSNDDRAARSLAALDQGSVATSKTTSIPSWENAHLVVHADARWRHPGHAAPLLRVEGSRVLRDVEHSNLVGRPDILDITEEVEAARSSIALRDRRSLAVWQQPTSQRTELNPTAIGAGQSRLTIAATCRIDPLTAHGGSPLPHGLWDVGAHNAFLWGHNHRRIETSSGWSTAALIHGIPVRAFATPSGTLAIDVGQVSAPLINGLHAIRTRKAGLFRTPVLRLRDLYLAGKSVDIEILPSRPDWARRRPASAVWRLLKPFRRAQPGRIEAGTGLGAILRIDSRHSFRLRRRLSIVIDGHTSTVIVDAAGSQ